MRSDARCTLHAVTGTNVWSDEYWQEEEQRKGRADKCEEEVIRILTHLSKNLLLPLLVYLRPPPAAAAMGIVAEAGRDRGGVTFGKVPLDPPTNLVKLLVCRVVGTT